MNYALAKQLKDAGFPKDWSQMENHDPELLVLSWDIYGSGYSPTLSELIEACGEDFRWLKLRTKDLWLAQGRPHPVGKKEPRCYAPTPEEAVAKLWLELNK